MLMDCVYSLVFTFNRICKLPRRGVKTQRNLTSINILNYPKNSVILVLSFLVWCLNFKIYKNTGFSLRSRKTTFENSADSWIKRLRFSITFAGIKKISENVSISTVRGEYADKLW